MRIFKRKRIIQILELVVLLKSQDNASYTPYRTHGKFISALSYAHTLAKLASDKQTVSDLNYVLTKADPEYTEVMRQNTWF